MPSAFDLWPFAFGVRPSAHGLRPAACGLWPAACGLWPAACGLRPVAFGLRPAACGLRPSAFGFINQNVLGKQGNSQIISNPSWHKLAKRGIKIEEYLYSRYSLGANTKSTGTKGVYGNNIPSVLTFSSQNNSRDNCNTQSHQYIFPDTDTDTKGVLGNTIAFVSTTLSNKPAFYNLMRE